MKSISMGCGLLLAMSVSAQAQVPTPVLPPSLQDLDARVERVRKQFDVPGIAIAIVKDGQVVLERGYGVRELGKPEPVDAQTLFAIASNTKAFTAAALSILADEGKLSLDDRVVEHLPWFQMSDPYVTREMRVRDLLAHRSGLSLGAGDLLFLACHQLQQRGGGAAVGACAAEGGLPRPLRLRQHPICRGAEVDRAGLRAELRGVRAAAHLRARGHAGRTHQQRSSTGGRSGGGRSCQVRLSPVAHGVAVDLVQ